jgi:hypothetical protein
MSFDDKKVAIEHLEREQTGSDDLVELSGIEATATSKAAWLIAITVSIGGFLFGQQYSHHCTHTKLTVVQAMTLATSHPSSSH